MGFVEEERAFSLICSQLGNLGKGRKLKIGIDVDDTAADVMGVLAPVLAKRHDVPLSRFRNRFDISGFGINGQNGLGAYTEIWNERRDEIKPLLSRRAYMMLNEIAVLSFVTARPQGTVKSLRKWVERHYGGGARIDVLPPNPLSAHGARKLSKGYNILIDDAPHVAASMNLPIARDRALLLVDKWKEARTARNRDNTAIVADAEHAADLIFQAHELTE